MHLGRTEMDQSMETFLSENDMQQMRAIKKIPNNKRDNKNIFAINYIIYFCIRNKRFQLLYLRYRMFLKNADKVLRFFNI